MIWFLLAACGGGSTETDGPEDIQLQDIRLALNWFPEPEFGGFYEGVVGGHYEKAGFKVDIIPGGPGAPTLELLGTGRTEAAISAADDLLIKRHKGIKGVGVYPAFQNSPQGLMAHTVSGFEAIGDVPPGSTIAIELGSPFQKFLWSTFEWGDTVRAVPYTGLLGSFFTDESAIQQAYITSEPCLVKAKGGSPVFLEASAAGWNPYGSLLVLPDPLPEWSDAFIKATHAAHTAYLNDPEQANAAILAANDQLQPALMNCIVEAQKPYLTGTDGLGTMTTSRWQAMNEQLVGLGLLPEGSTSVGAWKQ
jgi:NitT/TauT family transport system substrate-binding protein